MKTNIENTTKILEVKKMNKTEFDFKSRTIREVFSDTRKICIAPKHEIMLDEGVHPGGDIFTTEDGEYIDFETQLKDFDAEELAKYVEFAENLYEKHQKKVSVYILCPKNISVNVRECPLKSDADFKIKLACSQDDICHLILNRIKNKLKNEIALDCDDINAVEMLPVMCNRYDRNYFRVESIKILNMVY